MCREEAKDLVSLAKAGKLGRAKIYGLVKEVAPCSTAKTDAELGIEVFQKEYFNNFPIYLDEENTFYNELGNRKITELDLSLAFKNPGKFFKEFKALGKRLKDKKIEGNGRGNGLVLGGIFVISPNKKELVYTYKEITGGEIPSDEIVAAVKQC